MTTLPALLFVFLLSFPDADHLSSEALGVSGAPGVPVGLELHHDKSGALPWAAETRGYSEAPALVEMTDVIERARLEAELEKTLDPADRPPLKEKGRIPSIIPPEIAEIHRLQALLLPPSDRIQVFGALAPGESVALPESPKAQKASGPASLVQGFKAISAPSSPVLVPPDPELAVGPSHVIAAVNARYKIFSTDGTALTSSIKFETLMDANSNCDSDLFDPNVIYDEASDRFILAIDGGGEYYCMAVSATPNPLSLWFIYSFRADIGGLFFDYPHAGVGREAIYMGSNQFEEVGGNLSYRESRLFAFDKLDLYTGALATWTSWSLGRSSTPQPANLHGFAQSTWPPSTEPHYVVTGNGDSVKIWTLENPFTGGSPSSQSSLNLQTFTGVASGSPIDVPQLNSSDLLDPGDRRVQDLEYRNGHVWTVQSVSCNPGLGTVNCVRWAQIDPAANAIVDAGVFSNASLIHYLHPDLAVDKCGNLLVGYSASGFGFPPSVFASSRASDHPSGLMQSQFLQQLGEARYEAFDGSPLRWGDYTGATVSPDGRSLWYLGEFADDDLGDLANWGTHIGQYQFPDSDFDSVPDSCDLCPGGIDALDIDGDGVPTQCDRCFGFDDNIDTDDDGVPNGCDLCAGSDDTVDSDDDDVPDGCDLCPGSDDAIDTDDDGVPNGCDICPGSDDALDTDDDGVPNGCDICAGFDDAIDTDHDDVPNGCDICEGFDDTVDADGDGIPDGCDPCFGPDNVDADNDGVCESLDLCLGDDATGDGDSDGRCANLDCNDGNPSVQDPDRCGVCEGDGTSCVVLYPVGDVFAVSSTAAGEQTEPRLAASADGFLVTWTSDDGDSEDIRARRFADDGTAQGNDFVVNLTASGDQDAPDVTALTDASSGRYVVAWESDGSDGDRTGIVARVIEGSSAKGDPIGDELDINSVTLNGQQRPRVAPAEAGGFAVVWETYDASGTNIARRVFDAAGSPTAEAGTETSLTGGGFQTHPDMTVLPNGLFVVAWADDANGIQVRDFDDSGSLSLNSRQVSPASGTMASPAMAADGMGRGLAVWTDTTGDAGDPGVFARPFDGILLGNDTVQVNAPAGNAQQTPAVAALDDGGFLVAFEDRQTGDVRAQVYRPDGSPGAVVPGALAGDAPFVVNQDSSTSALEPAVAAHPNGTFFVVWSDSNIDGNGTRGIAGRLLGTDFDADEVPVLVDNCPNISNADQADTDDDTVGDICDVCPAGDDRSDADGDTTADACDTCTDTDNDGAGNPGFDTNTCATDNCPDIANADQLDADTDGLGDVCDTCTDTDNDGAGNPGYAANTCVTDNCPDIANADQLDIDDDGIGDACDLCVGDNATGDSDGDGICADNDCDDNDGNAQEIDQCGICGGDNTTCAELFNDGFESGDTSSWSASVF